MRPIALGFQIPSLRGVCEANAQLSSEAAAAAQTLTVPYPIGRSTLQISGIHARLGPVKTSADKRNSAGKPGQVQPRTKSSPSAPASGGALAVDIVVHAHVRGEMNRAPRSYVVAVIPLRFDGTVAPVSSVTASSSSVIATHRGASTLLPAPYDKRVINAQARNARRGVIAPVFPSAFARIDLRTQMERVRLSFTVVPCGKTAGTGASANGAAHAHAGKRVREANSKTTDESASVAPLDCAIYVTVVGTVSAIA
ncbi:hypothetical protein LSCM1_07321 [Leishmania martiniquensis]|uniref:Uncharacterized protein n=1 Tax=Leishmania martiniquensis TaxID=1580590 RepID=A0A836KTB8_9TRYP|nr:hypothetical protein LSCM1_07321 [Leishmania martiniquensis]